MDAYPNLNTLYLSPRLQARLADAAGYPVTTIVAPTGYGKTTAAQYLQRRIAAEAPDARVFRQFLSGGGRQEFWAGLCRALHTAPQLSAQLLALGYPDSPHTRQQLLELVQDALPAQSPVWFILDDVHLLQGGEAAELVSFLTERLPLQVHLLLLSRNQIFSEAQKLRLGSRLLELSAADLRLTQEELAQYAGLCGLPLPERESQALLSVSEGWIAMVYLIFRAYAQTGTWRFDTKGMDTLIEQVMFEPLPERQRLFLLDNCLAEDFTAEQHPAEVARHDAHDVFDVFALEDVEHRLFRRTLRLAVVAVANGTVVQDEAPAVVARVVVFLLHLVDARAGLRLGLHKENVADEARALFFKLALRALVWDKVLCHGFNVPSSGFSPTFLS